MTEKDWLRILNQKNKLCSEGRWPILPVQQSMTETGIILIKSNADSEGNNIFLEIEPNSGNVLNYYWSPGVTPHP